MRKIVISLVEVLRVVVLLGLLYIGVIDLFAVMRVSIVQVLILAHCEGLVVTVGVVANLACFEVSVGRCSVSSVLMLTSVVLRVARGLIFDCFIGLGAVRAFSVAVLKRMSFAILVLGMGAVVAVNIVCAANMLIPFSTVVVRIASLFVSNVMTAVVDQRGLVSVNIDVLVNNRLMVDNGFVMNRNSMDESLMVNRLMVYDCLMMDGDSMVDRNSVMAFNNSFVCDSVVRGYNVGSLGVTVNFRS